jgi:hypothetical protein
MLKLDVKEEGYNQIKISRRGAEHAEKNLKYSGLKPRLKVVIQLCELCPLRETPLVSPSSVQAYSILILFGQV